MEEINPYTIPAGGKLDELIHIRVLRKPLNGPVPHYSTEEAPAEWVYAWLRGLSGAKIVVGQSKLRASRRWFARHEKDPSTGTEVMAETYPLAVCRLALLMRDHYGK